MKLVTIIGARPQFVKYATVSHALVRLGLAVDDILIHTGQHYDTSLSEQFFLDLAIANPAYNLGAGSGTHGQQTGQMLIHLDDVLCREQPDVVVVYGDTNSTLAGALAASKLGMPVAHVEAGMRSFNRRAPEEINRVVTDHLATLLLCANQLAVDNLEAEGITRGVVLVGNVMHDALLESLERAEQRSTILSQLGLESGAYYLATVHRAENTDDDWRLRSIVSALARLSATLPVVWPVHPRTGNALKKTGVRALPASLRLLKPASYLDMLVLEKHARAILTDAGGVTNEAFWLRVPCITLREETEWPETVAAGWNTLAGAQPERVIEAARQASRPPEGDCPAAASPGANERVARALVSFGAAH